MKKLWVSCLLLLWFQELYAQQDGTLSAPSSPAFSILDFEPAAVLKPGNLKDLGADLLSAFDENGRLRMNLGLEVAPYWLKSRPWLTNQQYNNPSLAQSILQTLSISAATVKDSASQGQKLGLGIRFKLKNGATTREYLDKKAELEQLLAAQALFAVGRSLAKDSNFANMDEAKQFINDALNDAGVISMEQKQLIRIWIEEESKLHGDAPAALMSFFEALVTRAGVDQVAGVAQKVYALSKKRVGFFLELAGATGFASGAGEPSLERAGIWLTASQVVNASNAWHFNLRYQFANRDTSINNFDAGFAYSTEMPRFNLSIEALARWYRATIPDFNSNNQPILRLEKDFTYRFAVQAAYQLSKDISVNLSLGKNFTSPFIASDAIFSIFGLNYSVFKKVPVLVKGTE